MNILFTLCGRAGSKGVKGKMHVIFRHTSCMVFYSRNFTLYREVW